MEKNKKTYLLIFSILSVFYFVLFIFPNLTGAKDVVMISAFEHDEFAQYPHVVRMITPGETFYQSIRNFVVYLHYFYGYPFYFFSAISIFPVKLILGPDWVDHTRIIMMVLRQMINVLPMLLSALFLVYVTTKFKVLWKALLIFIFLLTIPAVVSNNMWWHPDSLLTLFSVLTIFFLIRDDFKFGKNFYFSGIACGLAIGAKILGVLFVLTYAVYLFYGLISKRIKVWKFLKSSILLLLIVVGTVIVSNPLLLLPIERGEIINVFKLNLQESTSGFWVFTENGNNNINAVLSVLSTNYVFTLITIAAFISLSLTIKEKDKRVNSIVNITWFIGFMTYFLFIASTIRPHYFLPVMIPFYSNLMLFIPDDLSSIFGANKKTAITKKKWNILYLIVPLLIVVQIGINISKSTNSYLQILNREKTSGSINLYQDTYEKHLSKIPDERKITIYRDWRAYVEPKENYSIEYDWSLANYELIEELNPDLLFIEYDNTHYFSDESKIEQAIRPEEMVLMNRFYSDVYDEEVRGYRLLNKTDFGYVFIKNSLFEEIFIDN